jgi:hypothetical protein
MRKLLQMSSSSANNDKGNAVAIVLLVLAVVSILGVGLLTQSTMDLKFATSYKSNATAFNLADGAASLALVAVPNTFAPQYASHPVPIPPLRNANYRNPTALPALEERGTYWPVLLYQGAITDPNLLPGYDLDEFYVDCWTAKGTGTRRGRPNTGPDTSGQAASNAQVRLGRHLPTQIDVQIPTYKMVKK